MSHHELDRCIRCIGCRDTTKSELYGTCKFTVGECGWGGGQRIWKEAEFRAVSLQRAEAGLGDTLWTARVRRNTEANKKAKPNSDSD